MSTFSTKHATIFAGLARPFEDEEVRTRPQGNRTLHYVTASTVANRLDDVLGPENWEFDLKPWGEDALFGTLSIKLPDGSVIKKMNVGGCADMPEGDNDAKSAASDCLKRCAALFGIGRYLYQCGWPEFADPLFEGFKGHPEPHGGGYQSRPSGGYSPPPSQEPRGRDQINEHFNGQRSNGNGSQGGGRQYTDADLPKNPRGLFAWAKGIDERNPGLDLVNRINAWSKKKGFPFRMTEFSDQQMAETIAMVQQAIGGGQAQQQPQGPPEPAASAQTTSNHYKPGVNEEDIPF